jgi:hypothetical protein
MSSYPFVPTSNVFNTNNYKILDEGLTIEEANNLYLSLSDPRLNTITGITAGIASSGKALVLDGSLNITGINDLSSSFLETKNTSNTLITNSTICSEYGLHLHSVLSSSNGIYSGSSISFNNSLNDNVPLSAICLDKIGSGNGELIFSTRNGATCDERVRISDLGLNVNGNFYQNSTLVDISATSGITLGIAQTSKALTLNSFGNLQFNTGSGSGNSRNGTNALQWYGNTAFKEKILMYRPNDDTGLVIASNPSTIQKCSPLLYLYSGFDATGVIGTSSAEYKEVLRSEHKLVGLSDNYRSGWFHGYLLGTQPWQSSGFGYCTQFYTSIGTLNISCNSSATNSFASSNNLLLLNTGRMVYNSLTPFTNGTYGNASFTLNNSNLYIKTTSTFNDGSANYSMAMLLDGTNANPVRFAFQLHTGPASTSTNPAFLGTVSANDLAFMTDNTRRMTLTSIGRLGIGTATPSCGLDVATGENLVTTTTNIAINTLSYNVSNNTWSNLGGGVVSVTMTARIRGSAWIQDKIYATSDRRLKTDITPLDFTLEHYNKLNPVSYKWKNNEKTMLGVIAQDMQNICAESITAIENPNMKKENDDDTAGYQLTVDYNCINMMNVVAIKKLIKIIETQNNKINNIESKLTEQQKFLDSIEFE